MKNRTDTGRIASTVCRCTFANLLIAVSISLASASTAGINAADINAGPGHWIGTWSAAPQPSLPGRVKTYGNQSLRLIVHASAGGKAVRIRISNTFGDRPLAIGAAHIARRSAGADIEPASDRRLTFGGHASIAVPAGSMQESDPVEMDVPPLSDLAISLFLPKTTAAATAHILALQTSYVSPAAGDCTAAAIFPVDKTIVSWPFLTGIDVSASPHAAAIVAFGSSTPAAPDLRQRGSSACQRCRLHRIGESDSACVVRFGLGIHVWRSQFSS